jgi:hypothetical protein
MKNLPEQEILSRLYTEKQECRISRKDLTEPDYEVWGRARIWLYHQAVCLVAGFTPIEQSAFDFYVIHKKCSIHTFGNFDIDDSTDYTSYSLKQNDLEKLIKTEQLLRNLFKLSLPTNDDLMTVFIVPAFLLERCKNSQEMSSLFPEKLANIIAIFGAHPSRNLPDQFSCLELNASQLEDLARKKAWQTTSGMLFPIPAKMSNKMHIEKVATEPYALDLELRRCRPEQLARQAARTVAAAIWKKKPTLPLLKLLNEETFKKILETMAKINGKTDGYSEETRSNWIRDLNPNYKPRSKRSPRAPLLP